MVDPTDEEDGGGDRLTRVATCWDRTTASRQQSTAQGWLDSYYVASRRLNEQVSGSPNVNWLVGLARRLEIPADTRWLSIGCGTADQEIDSAKEGLFRSLDAVDISPASLEVARKRAEAEGIDRLTFRQADFYRLDPEPGAYDVVLMNMSLHHVEDLDTVLSNVIQALRPEGFFLIHEYVGPRQFQFTDRQLAIVRSLLQALPPDLRRHFVSGEVKESYVRQPVEYWNEVDPSESIRSDLIVRKVQRYFHVCERIDYGGTILHLLLEHIVHNFDPGDGGHRAILDLLGAVEDLLIDYGVLTSDFTVMALQPKGVPDAETMEVPPPAAGERASRRELEMLRGQLEEAQIRLRTMESARGWRLIQWLRGLVGRRW